MTDESEDTARELRRLRERVGELEASAGADERLLRAEVRLAESEARFQRVFEYSNDAILLIDPDRDEVLDANPQGCRLLGYTLRELCSQSLGALFPHDLARLQAFALSVVEEGPGWIDEIGCQTRTGDPFVVEVSASEVPLEAQRSCLLLLLRDISVRKADDDRIRASLREKEVLLREIHHRVKNNLQVVSSLFDLQATRTEDPEVQSMLRECRNRVRSMAAIHESLYRAHDLARVDFRRYATSLTEELLRSFGAGDRVALQVDMDDVVLDVDQAIPCGLIVNELVSNALKHAFPGGTAGCLRLGMSVADEIELIVADDGRGLPDDFDTATSASLGLRLVDSLVHQLGGRLDVNGGDETIFRMCFPTRD